jgi:hypothetical protein
MKKTVKRIVEKLSNKFGGVKKGYIFLPLYAKYQDLALVFTQTGTYVETIVLRDKKLWP